MIINNIISLFIIFLTGFEKNSIFLLLIKLKNIDIIIIIISLIILSNNILEIYQKVGIDYIFYN